MQNILITGSKGFIGKQLTNKLKELNYSVIEVKNSTDLDLTNNSLVQHLPKVDLIIHLAAKSFIPDSFIFPHNFYQNNIISTLNLLEKARVDKAKFIFLSTYVYGVPNFLPIKENHPLQPLNPYTQSKVICEELCNAFNRDYKIPITIFRPFNIYGPGQNEIFLIPKILMQIQSGLITLNDNRPKRDFIYITDVVDAIIKAVVSNNEQLNIYNLGSGVSTKIVDVAYLIANMSNNKVEINFSNKIRQGEVLETIADIEKIRRELNWKPKIDIEEGIKQVLSLLND